MILTIQSLHFTSCVPISLLSHQKTSGHPSPAGGLLLSQSLPCSRSGSPAAPMGGSSSVTLLSGADLVWFASQLAVCGLVRGGISPQGLLAARFVAGGVARVSRQWLHSTCPGRALGCRSCCWLRPELCAGATLQFQTNSAQPLCSHRHWHPPQSHVTNPGRLSSHAGGPSVFQQQGDAFLFGYKGDFSI